MKIPENSGLESIPMLQLEKMADRDGFRLEFGKADITVWVPKGQQQYAWRHSRLKDVSALIVEGEYYRVQMKVEKA